MELKVKVNKRGDGSVIVSPEGSIDTDTYSFLQSALDEITKDSIRGVILDMTKVDYVSSIGISVIVRAKQALQANGATLVMSNLQPNVKKIFESVKSIPESLFATLREADEYLDKYISFISRKDDKGK